MKSLELKIPPLIITLIFAALIWVIPDPYKLRNNNKTKTIVYLFNTDSYFKNQTSFCLRSLLIFSQNLLESGSIPIYHY